MILFKPYKDVTSNELKEYFNFIMILFKLLPTKPVVRMVIDFNFIMILFKHKKYYSATIDGDLFQFHYDHI